MTSAQLVATCLLLLAAAHSALGPRLILAPMLATTSPESLRFRVAHLAWHHTSACWVAFAIVLLGGGVWPTVGALCLGTAAVGFGFTRGHLSWPIFGLAGLAALRHVGVVPDALLRAGGWSAVALAVAAAGLHLHWLFGGRWLLDRAVPKRRRPTGRSPHPGRVALLAVLAALFAYASCLVYVLNRSGDGLARWAVVAGTVVLVVRAIGDADEIGFSRRTYTTAFAQADAQWFTPVVVAIAAGSAASLLV